MAHILISERFRQLLKAQDVHMTFFEGLRLFLIGHFFNFVLPGGVGGDLVKAYYLKKENSHTIKSTPYTVIFDRFLGLYTMMFMALVVIAFNFSDIQDNPRMLAVCSFVLTIFVVLSLFAAAAFSQPLRHLVERLLPRKWPKARELVLTFMSSFEYYSRSPRRIAVSFMLTVIAQSLAFIALYQAGEVAGQEHLPLSAYFYIAPIGMAVSSLPIAPPGGIGVGQAAFVFLFNTYLGTKSTVGATVITIHQFMSLCIGLSGLYFYLARKKAA